MTALILIALIQAPQDIPIEERIEAFIKGDDDVRKYFQALGAYAIRPLLKARDRSPERIDALVLELKKAAAYPSGAVAVARFDGVITIRDQELEAIVPTMQSIGLPIFLDRFRPGDLKSTKVTFENVMVAQAALEQICRQTGLDYGFFHNAIVLGLPERLWPAGPPAKPLELRGEALTQAKSLVEKLNDDAIEAREAATRDLLTVGPSAIPLLEENLRRKESEIVARCSALIEKLRPSGRGAFGPPGAHRQTKTPETGDILKKFQAVKVTLDFQDTSLDNVAGYLKEFTGIGFEVQGATGGKVITLKAKDQVLLDILSLMTQSREMDFMIQEGKVLIDTREAIQKSLNTTK